MQRLDGFYCYVAGIREIKEDKLYQHWLIKKIQLLSRQQKRFPSLLFQILPITYLMTSWAVKQGPEGGNRHVTVSPLNIIYLMN